MLIKRKLIFPMNILFESKSKLHFSIETQYKIIKLKKITQEELNLYNEQIDSLSEYFELGENGKPIQNEKGIKIKDEYVSECSQKIFELDNSEVQLPDIYFSLDELEPLNLTLEELELLEPFIKT